MKMTNKHNGISIMGGAVMFAGQRSLFPFLDEDVQKNERYGLINALFFR
jgi:hypothetical protein